MAPKLSHRFNFSHLNSRQRMSNSGPCPASHVLPPFCGPLRLLLPSPHLRPEFMDGSQPHPDTVGSSLPVFILERDGLSPLTHPGGPTGRPTQVAAPVLTGTPHARVLACMCVCVCVHPRLCTHTHQGVGVPGSVCGARRSGRPSWICPLSLGIISGDVSVCPVEVGTQGLGTTRCIPRPHSSHVSLVFPGEG